MLVHAAGESSPGNLSSGTHAIVLSVPNELELARAADRLERVGVQITRIHEPDAPHDNALMAIGLAPGRKESLRKHLSCLPLLR